MTTLPSPAPHDPLLGWEHWPLPWQQKPALIRKLAPGFTNHSYLIAADNEQWVLRYSSEKTATLGIDRGREAIILKAVAAAGLAPEILLCSVEKGILISRYITGQHWQASDARDKAKQKKILELMERVHEIDIALPGFNYLQHLENYWQALRKTSIAISDALYREYEKLEKEISEYSDRITLCHHDPNPGNIIHAHGKLYLLDWEYAGNGWPGFDAAALSSEWDIQAEQTDDSRELMKTFYTHLCVVWALLREGSTTKNYKI